MIYYKVAIERATLEQISIAKTVVPNLEIFPTATLDAALDAAVQKANEVLEPKYRRLAPIPISIFKEGEQLSPSDRVLVNHVVENANGTFFELRVIFCDTTLARS